MIEIKDNSLFIDGLSAKELAKKFGTPLYVYSYDELKKRINDLKENFLGVYERTRVAYAAKAFSCKAMFQIMKQENFCIDVVSGGELFTAMSIDFPADNIEFNGNNKSEEEIRMALEYGIGRFIVDGYNELKLLQKLCKETGKKATILFRVTPGVASDSHDYIVTGRKDSKFGFPIDEDILVPVVEEALESESIELLGFHFHVGSQLLNNESHLQAADIVMGFIKNLKEKIGFETKELNIGGGFGIRYTDENPPPFSYFTTAAMEAIIAYCDKEDLYRPEIVIEPGRSMVGEAGITLYEVGNIKNIPDIRKYVSLDGGMGDNLRPALYQAEYRSVVVDRAEEKPSETVTFCGKYCESGDILIKNAKTVPVEKGDIVALFSTGAYGYAMANNYNRNPIPPVILVKNQQAGYMVKPQSFEDILRLDEVPDFIK